MVAGGSSPDSSGTILEVCLPPTLGLAAGRTPRGLAAEVLFSDTPAARSSRLPFPFKKGLVAGVLSLALMSVVLGEVTFAVLELMLLSLCLCFILDKIAESRRSPGRRFLPLNRGVGVPSL